MSIELSFHGAAGGVTGSSFLLATSSARVLIDCGLFQGSRTERELNNRPFPYRPEQLDAVLLTHAHIDHSGLLPRLMMAGYAGPIWATAATRDLCAVMLPDSGHIQELESARSNQRGRWRAKNPVPPTYTVAQAEAVMRQFRSLEYGEWTPVAQGIRARYWNAGHLLGSASIEIEATDGVQTESIVFSGDLGPGARLLHPDPAGPSGVDYLVCESTYGDTDRLEATSEERRRHLRDEVLAAERRGGALLIPAFAVERTQELVVDLVALMREGAIAQSSIFIDSPLATRASQVFREHAHELELGAELVSALNSHHVRFTESVDQSKALDQIGGFHIIIAGSGMCDAGRIRHRLRNWLWRREATVLMVGFQAEGTLGRLLVDGERRVRISGDEIIVAATIVTLDAYSGHADGPQLADWVRARQPIRKGVFLVHGETEARAGLVARLDGVMPADRLMSPLLDDRYALAPEGPRALVAANPPRIEPLQVARRDTHNDLAALMLDLSDAVDAAADERGRAALIRKLRRALEDDGTR